MENTYSVFSVRPYGKTIAKAITKNPKVYLFYNAEVLADEGARIENLIATHLLKRIQFLEDFQGDRYELNYLRDKEGHEIDFVILKNGKPVCMVEVKVSDAVRSKSFHFYRERLKIDKCIQLVRAPVKPSTKDGILVISARDWLARPLEEPIFDE